MVRHLGGDQHAQERGGDGAGIKAAGVKPEIEVFDSGDIKLANQLLDSGVLPRPPFFQVVLGAGNGFASTPETLMYARSLLPADAVWAAMGIGAMEFPIVAQACLLGGHVRVGLEDNLYISKGVLAPSNAALVERAAQIVGLLGKSVATTGRGARDSRPATPLTRDRARPARARRRPLLSRRGRGRALRPARPGTAGS